MSKEDKRERWTQLYGGSVNTVHQRGDIVRRQTGPASPAVHQVLGWLEHHNFHQAPKLLRTAGPYEFLTFLPGKPVLRPWPEEVKREDWMTQLGDWLRRYHQVIEGFRLEGDATFLWGPTEPEEGMIVCYADFGPTNIIQEKGKLIGVIDWDLARYAGPLYDVAELALETVPLRAVVEEVMGEGVDKLTLQKRLSAFCEAYGIEPGDVLRYIPVYLSQIIREIKVQAERDIAPFPSFVKRGVIQELEADKAYVEEVWLR